MKNRVFGLIEKIVLIGIIYFLGTRVLIMHENYTRQKNTWDVRTQAMIDFKEILEQKKPSVSELKEFMRKDMEAMFNTPVDWNFKVEIRPLKEFDGYLDWEDDPLQNEDPGRPYVIRLYEDEHEVIRKISGSPRVWSPMVFPGNVIAKLEPEETGEVLRNETEKVNLLFSSLEKVLDKGDSLKEEEEKSDFLPGYNKEEKIALKSHSFAYQAMIKGLLKALSQTILTPYDEKVRSLQTDLRETWLVAQARYVWAQYPKWTKWPEQRRSIIFIAKMGVMILGELFFLYHLLMPSVHRIFGQAEEEFGYSWAMREKMRVMWEDNPKFIWFLWKRREVIRNATKAKAVKKNEHQTGQEMGARADEIFQKILEILNQRVPRGLEGEYRVVKDEGRDLPARSQALHTLEVLLARAPWIARQSPKTKGKLLVPVTGIREEIEEEVTIAKLSEKEDERVRGKGRKILKPHEQKSLLDTPLPPLPNVPAKNGNSDARVHLAGKKVAVLVGDWTKGADIRKRFQEVLENTFGATVIFINIFDVPKLEERMKREKPDFCVVYSKVASHMGFWKAKEILTKQGKPTSNVILLDVINERRIKEELMKKAQ